MKASKPYQRPSPNVDSSVSSLWVCPFLKKAIRLRGFLAGLWIFLQVSFGLLAMPWLTILLMASMTEWGWVGHNDVYTDIDRLSVATVVFFGLMSVGPLIVAGIPLPIAYRRSARVWLRCLCFVFSLLLFWPALLVIQITVMVFVGGYS